MKKHQLFRNKSYIQLRISENLIITGQVLDSTVEKKALGYNDIFEVPQESILIDSTLLINYGYGQLHLYEVDELLYEELVSTNKSLKHSLFRAEDGNIRVRVCDLEPVVEEGMKAEFRKRRSLYKQTK